MLFSLKSKRINRKNVLAVDSTNGKTGEKGHIFTVLWKWNNLMLWRAKCFNHGTRQEDICIRLCHRKRLMLFSLKSKRINRQNALAEDSANRKLEKKAVFSLYCRNKAILCHDRAKKICVLGCCKQKVLFSSRLMFYFFGTVIVKNDSSFHGIQDR